MEKPRTARRPANDRNPGGGGSLEIGGIRGDTDAVGDCPVDEDRRTDGRRSPAKDHLVGADVLRTGDSDVDPGGEARTGGRMPRLSMTARNGLPSLVRRHLQR